MGKIGSTWPTGRVGPGRARARAENLNPNPPIDSISYKVIRGTFWSEYFSHCALLTRLHARHWRALAGPGSVGFSPQINKHITSDYSPSYSAGGNSIRGRIIHSSCRSLLRPWPRVESGGVVLPITPAALQEVGHHKMADCHSSKKTKPTESFKLMVSIHAALYCGVTDGPTCRLFLHRGYRG